MEVGQYVSQSVQRVLGFSGTLGSVAGRLVSIETLWVDFCRTRFGFDSSSQEFRNFRWVYVAPVTM